MTHLVIACFFYIGSVRLSQIYTLGLFLLMKIRETVASGKYGKWGRIDNSKSDNSSDSDKLCKIDVRFQKKIRRIVEGKK